MHSTAEKILLIDTINDDQATVKSDVPDLKHYKFNYVRLLVSISEHQVFVFPLVKLQQHCVLRNEKITSVFVQKVMKNHRPLLRL